VKAASEGPCWFQLYLVGGRATAEAAIDRARVAGFSAIVITIDTAVARIRERDLRNGMTPLLSGSVLAKLPFLPQLFAHPRWLAAFLLDGGVLKLLNIVTPARDRRGSSTSHCAGPTAAQSKEAQASTGAENFA
jgi:L-lactate dehydrogenase (cytochrome)